jgi:hypothetical protein
MTQKPRVTTLYPQNRLSELIQRPGGQSRSRAVAAAAQALQDRRRPVLDEIGALIAALEGKPAADLDSARMDDIAILADRIVSLALLMDLESLAQAAMRLCDLGHAFGGAPQADSIAVHVQALRLLAPDAPRLTPRQTEAVLAGLARLLRHVNGAG